MFENVTIDIRKLRDYCLNPNHPVGKHKARVFSSHLGLTRNDAEKLKDEITKNVKKAQVHTEHEDEFGKRFSAEIELNIKNMDYKKRRKHSGTCYLLCYHIN